MRKFVPGGRCGRRRGVHGCSADRSSGRDYPFCIKGDSYDSPLGDCSFDTYQQCLATASGGALIATSIRFFCVPEEAGLC